MFGGQPEPTATRDGEQPPPSGDGTARLTYAQLAVRLGISNEAARQLVRRRKWQRIKPNRLGAPAIVVVPEDELAGEQWRQERPTPPDNRGAPPATSPVDPHTSPDDRGRQSSEISGLVALLTAEHERADRAEAGLRALQGELVAEKEARAKAEGKAEATEQAVLTERARVDELRIQVDALQAEREEGG